MTVDQAPGWYPDPAAPALERWWDGAEWAEWTRVPEPLADPGPRALPQSDAIALNPDTDNPAIWWLELWPAWWFLVTAALMAFTGFGVVVLVFWFASLVMVWYQAERDRKLLLARGAVDAARAMWVLLTPLAYLLARWRVLRAQGIDGRHAFVFGLVAAAVPVFFSTMWILASMVFALLRAGAL